MEDRYIQGTDIIDEPCVKQVGSLCILGMQMDFENLFQTVNYMKCWFELYSTDSTACTQFKAPCRFQWANS